MEALDSPLIQLGFYWHGRDQTESFRCLLRWLLTRGYKVAAEVIAFKAVGGKLPAFSQISLGGIEGVESGVFTDWTTESTLRETEWLPVRVRLLPKAARDVRVNLGYARMSVASLLKGAHHAVEIQASGADLDLLDNVPASQLAASVVASARRIARWQRSIFELACKECEPDYAGCFMEWELQPPWEIAREEKKGHY